MSENEWSVDDCVRLARSICADIARYEPAAMATAVAAKDVRETFAKDIDEGRRLFVARAGAARAVVFDRAVEVCLVQQKPEALAADPLVDQERARPRPATPLGGDAWDALVREIEAAVDAQLTFVDANLTRGASMFQVRAALVERPDQPALVRVVPAAGRDGDRVEVSLDALVPDGEDARLSPERGVLAFLKRMGELEIGDKIVDDAFIIDAEQSALATLRHLAEVLRRLAPFVAQLELKGVELSATVEVEAKPVPIAEVVDALLDLWSRVVTYRMGM